MLPNIWIFDTYSIMLLIGVICCFYLFYKYGMKYKFGRKYTYDILLLACISILSGLIFAFLFQKLFDYLKNNEITKAGSMTFFGGLVGGVLGFIIGYILVIKKNYPNRNLILDICPIAPSCITIAHGFGRIGCFFAGCCYGIKTDSIFGVVFPNVGYAVYPTQLFEALFLFILSGILFYLAYKKRFLYTFSIYTFSYGVFRFLIEFIRGDDRGAYFLGLSPSQVFSLIALTISIVLDRFFPDAKIYTVSEKLLHSEYMTWHYHNSKIEVNFSFDEMIKTPHLNGKEIIYNDLK